MADTTEILSIARERKQAASLPYAGAVTPDEAFALLKADHSIRLIDVRTQAERDWVGKVDVPDGQHYSVQWTLYPGGAKNPEFLSQLAQCAQPGDVLLFLCRSGVRSRFAAELATANGYSNCFDILEGFEGDRNDAGHRKTLGGWCKSGLPWIGA